MFGLAPLIAGLLSALLLDEESLTPWKVLGILLGVTGLGIIFLTGDRLGGEHFIGGLVALLAAVFFYSFCLVGLKRIGDDSPPLATTVGSLAVATPCLPFSGLLAVLCHQKRCPGVQEWRSSI